MLVFFSLTVLLSGLATIKEAFVERGEEFSDRPQGAYPMVQDGKEHSLLMSLTKSKVFIKQRSSTGQVTWITYE